MGNNAADLLAKHVALMDMADNWANDTAAFVRKANVATSRIMKF